MLRKVYLEGEIADRFGSEFEIEANSFADVMSCLNANFDDFRQYITECYEKGIGFVCQINGKGIQKEEELLLNYKEGDMIISAMPMGSKGGIGKIIAAVVIAVILMTPGLREAFLLGSGPGAAAATLTGFGKFMAMVAINLAMTGLQEMMAPDPSVDDSVQQDESYLFQGAGQTILEGDPVPVLYGELRIPGRPISFGIKNENRGFTDIAQPASDSVEPYDPGGYSSSGGDAAPDHTKDPNNSQDLIDWVGS